MAELDGSLGLGIRPVWFPSASGGNSPSFQAKYQAKYPPVQCQYPCHSAIFWT
jgi:hypothetical protein